MSAARTVHSLLAYSAAIHCAMLAVPLAVAARPACWRLGRWDRWKEGLASHERCDGMVCRWRNCGSNDVKLATTS